METRQEIWGMNCQCLNKGWKLLLPNDYSKFGLKFRSQGTAAQHQEKYHSWLSWFGQDCWDLANLVGKSEACQQSNTTSEDLEDEIPWAAA